MSIPASNPGSHAQARFWNRFARRYAALKIGDPAGFERTIARTAGLVAGTADILEIGCGTGTIALRLAPQVGRILATDISSEMITIARQKAAADGCTNVEWLVASAETVPAEPASFDAVLAFAVLHLAADRAAALAHIGGLLKPGGVLVTKTPCMAELRLRYRLLIPVLRAVGLAPRFAMLTGEALARDIAAAGFEIVETARHGSGPRDVRLFLVARRKPA